MNPTPAITQINEHIEATACKDIFSHAPPEFGLQVVGVAGATTLIAPSIPILMFNRVLGLGMQQPANQETLEQISRLYAQAGVQSFAVQPSPGADVPDLKQYGFEHRNNWAKVYRRPSLDVDVPTQLRIEQIGVEQAEAFARVTLTGFGMPIMMLDFVASGVGRPNWLHYMAFEGDTPVAGAALFVADGVGWLGLGSTLPEHRRRGGQGALMARRIRDAAKLGCGWVCTETGEDTPQRPNPSYHNMIRTGFELAYLRPTWVYQARH